MNNVRVYPAFRWVVVMVLVSFVIGAFGASAVIAGVKYVSSNGSNADGQSWATAYQQLQSALAVAEPGDEVWVAAGVHRPDETTASPNGTGNRGATFQLEGGVAIYGHFAGTESQLSQRDLNDPAKETILSGDLSVNDGPGYSNYGENSVHIVSASDLDGTAILDGFTITGGNANLSAVDDTDKGGGLISLNSGPIIRHCRFTLNRATARGGAVMNSGGSAQFIDCTFSENTVANGAGGTMRNDTGSQVTLNECRFDSNTAPGATGSAAGVSDAGSSLKLRRCTFSDNHASGNAGALGVIDGVAVTLVSCSFFGNTAGGSGGAFINQDAQFTAINCEFSGNSSVGEGGAFRWSHGAGNPASSATMVNCTFAGNTAGDIGGAGSVSSNSVIGVFANCILWGNSDVSGSGPGSQLSVQVPGNITVHHCLVQGGYSGTGNVSSNPQFQDADGNDNLVGTADDDLRVAALSPCIDAGANSAVLTDFLDLNGNGNMNEPTPLDLRGVPRFIDSPETDTGSGTPPIVDMGAYERGAERIYVNVTEGGADNGTSWTDAFHQLQSALAVARTGDEIWIAAGTYRPDETSASPNGTGSRHATFTLETGVAIYGHFAGMETLVSQRLLAGSVNETILSGDLDQNDTYVPGPTPVIGNYGENSEHVVTATNVDATAVLDGLTIRSGYGGGPGSQGGGLLATGSVCKPTIRNCAFLRNYAPFGAGIYHADTQSNSERMLIDHCTFTENVAASGAGILGDGTEVRATYCQFIDNRAPGGIGGGWAAFDAVLEIEDCTFENNSAGSGAAVCGINVVAPSLFKSDAFYGNTVTGDGGAIYIEPGAGVGVVGCFFDGNSSDNSGGAIYNATANMDNRLQIVTSSFSGNSALAFGGGLFGPADVTSTEFIGNEVSTMGSAGGGMLGGGAIVNCTFVNNSAANNQAGGNGGGFARAAVPPTAIRNCIFYGNTAPTDPQLDFGTDVQYSFVQGGYAGDGNINGNPLFRDIDGPNNIAGDSDDDLRLTPGSPCIDAGNNGQVPADTFDLDGDLNTAEPSSVARGGIGRFIEFISTPNTGVGVAPIVDMGAWEYRAHMNLVDNGSPSALWQSAGIYTNLQDALNAAQSTHGDIYEIWVANGTYTPDVGVGIAPGDRNASFQLVNGIAVYGGFSGNEEFLAQRNAAANMTILSGDLNGNDGPDFADNGENSYHVVTAELTNATAVLEGVTITGGNANGVHPWNDGAGVFSVFSSPTLRDCVILANIANDPADGFGGGMYNLQGSPRLERVEFRSNRSSRHGGGMYNVQGSAPTLLNCRFVKNSAFGVGGGIYHNDSNSWIVNTIFEGNTTTQEGGAAWNDGASPTYVNCVFVGNSSKFGGAMASIENSNPVLVNCTIAENTALVSGGGLYHRQGLTLSPAPVISNSVFWLNSDSGGYTSTAQIHTDSGAPTVNYCLVQGGWSGAGGTGIVTSDPLFIHVPSPGDDGNWDGVDDDYGDLHPYYFSPVIDKGSAVAIPADWADLDGDHNTAERTPLDLGGAARRTEDLSMTNGGAAGSPAVDIGAYEFQPPVATTPSVRVKADTTGFQNGSTWATAHSDLNAASCAALNSGGLATEIWTSAGIYRPGGSAMSQAATIKLHNGIALLGGFAGTEFLASERDPAANPTILSGDRLGDDQAIDFPNGATRQDNFHHVVDGVGADVTAVLDGFTITGGRAAGASTPDGGGLLLSFPAPGSPTIRNCTFERNTATHGGAVALGYTAAPRFWTCRFLNNHADDDGGAVFSQSTGEPIYDDCLFQENTAVDAGGAVAGGAASTSEFEGCTFLRNAAQRGGGLSILSNAAPRLFNCRFLGNRASSFGGGLYASGAVPTLMNSIFIGNNAEGATGTGGALFLNASNALVVNCSIASNEAYNGPAFYITGSTPSIQNDVIYANVARAAPFTPFFVSTSTPVVSYCLVQGGWSGSGDHNIDADPQFTTLPSPGGDTLWGTTDDQYGYLRLLSGSPAVDSGSNSAVLADLTDLDCDFNKVEITPLDLDGAPRRFDDLLTADNGEGMSPIVDRGAYETGPFVGSRILVDGQAPGPIHDGATWATAFLDLRDALNAAIGGACGNAEIWVAAGVYKPGLVPSATFQLADGIVLYGGFTGVETLLSQRNYESNPTILSGDLLGDDGSDLFDDNSNHVVTGSETSGLAILDGFIITGGYAAQPDSGGGFITTSGGPLLRNCTLVDNRANCASALDCSAGELTIDNLTLQNNPSMTGSQAAVSQGFIELIGPLNLEGARLDAAGATFEGPGGLVLGESSELQVHSAAPCGAEAVLSVAGAVGATPLFLPADNALGLPARWEISAPLTDCRLAGSNAQWYVAPSAQGGPAATLTWTGSVILADRSSGGHAEADFHDGGIFAITGELYDGPGPGATLLNPGQPLILRGRVGAFRVSESFTTANLLAFSIKPHLAPVDGFLVGHQQGLGISGGQIIDFTLAPAQQSPGPSVTSFAITNTMSTSVASAVSLTPATPQSTVTTIRTDISGTGDIYIEPRATLLLDGGSRLDLSGALPGSGCGDVSQAANWGRVTVDGTLYVRGSTVQNTNVDVKLGRIEGATFIANNDCRLRDAVAGTTEIVSFGGEFYVEGTSVIQCNVITSDGDRYLDLDPDPTAIPRPLIGSGPTANRFHVVITQGADSEQGELLELRTPDYDNSLNDGLSGAHPLAASAGYSDPWVIETLEVMPGAKVNLTNRAGFVFQDPGIEIPEAMYVKEVRLHEGAVLNTGLQRLYYQNLIADETSRIVDYPLLGFSLKTIAMEDDTEFSVRVRTRLRDTADEGFQPPEPPFLEGEIERIPFATIENPDNHAMRMSVRKSACPPGMPPCPPATSVAAHGSFARAAEDQIVVAFQYLFCGDASDELYVYLSDQPEASTGLGSPIAVIVPPASGPGSIGSGVFAEFTGLFPRNGLNFTRGTYGELELRGPNGCVLIDEWDPLACGSPECGDFDLSYYVSNVDMLYALTEVGTEVGQGNSCLDRASRDNYVDIGDVLLSDSLYGYNVASLCSIAGTVNFSGSTQAVSVPDDRLILAAKPGLSGDQSDRLYPVDVAQSTAATSLDPPGATGDGAYGPRGHGRLLSDGDGELYQLHSVQGLIRLHDGRVMVTPGEQTIGSNRVRVGLSNVGPGLSILDAAFDPDDPTIVYVVPVRVIPPEGPGQAYNAAAQLHLSEDSGAGIVTWSIDSMQHVYGLNPRLDPAVNTSPPEQAAINVQYVREVETDTAGHLFVTAARADNQNDWLLIYNAATGTPSEQRIRLSALPTPLRGPTAMKVNSDGTRLYIGSSLEDGDPASCVIQEFQLSGTGVVSVSPLRVLTVANMRFVSAIMEDLSAGDIWAVGFNLPIYDPYSPGFHFEESDPLFATPTLAHLPASGMVVSAETLIGADASLPISAVFSTSASPCDIGDVNSSGSVTEADAPVLASVLVMGTSDPELACRADINQDGQLNGKDVGAFVDLLLP